MAICDHVPPEPVFRSILYPASLAVSDQERLIRLADAAVAVRFVGAAGGSGYLDGLHRQVSFPSMTHKNPNDDAIREANGERMTLRQSFGNRKSDHFLQWKQ